MAEFRDRAHVGGNWTAPPPAIWNAMLDVAEDKLATQLSKTRLPSKLRLPTDLVKLRNSTGSALDAGSVLQLGDLDVDEADQRGFMFVGEEPAPDGSDSIAILLSPAADDDVVDAQMSGIVYCRLNVTHIQHKWADVDANNTVLQSHWHGRCEILWKELETTGDQDAIVRIGQMHRGPINGVITEVGSISSGGSGEVTVWWAGVESSPASTITAHLNWMSGGADGAEGAECQVDWHPDQQKYVISNLECSG